MQTFLQEIRDSLVRKDASILIRSESDQDDEIHPQRAASSSFGKKLEILQDCIEINHAVAPIRWTLEEQIRKGKKGEFKVDKKKVAEVRYDFWSVVLLFLPPKSMRMAHTLVAFFCYLTASTWTR